MYLQRQEVANVVTDDLVAHIETKFKVAVLGDIAGPVFSAEVDSIRGKTTVTYVVRARDLESIDPLDITWMSGPENVPWN